VRYHNRHRLPAVLETETGAAWCADLDEMLSEVDIVSIHCPHTAETHNLIDAARLELIGPNGYLINIARGEIVVEPALISALQAGAIAGAGLDVFTGEPAIDPRLLALRNVVLVPHMGSATIEGRTDTGAKVIANIRAWVDGHRPPDQVLEGWA
jgi:glyoxylate reductase